MQDGARACTCTYHPVVVVLGAPWRGAHHGVQPRCRRRGLPAPDEPPRRRRERRETAHRRRRRVLGLLRHLRSSGWTGAKQAGKANETGGTGQTAQHTRCGGWFWAVPRRVIYRQPAGCFGAGFCVGEDPVLPAYPTSMLQVRLGRHIWRNTSRSCVARYNSITHLAEHVMQLRGGTCHIVYFKLAVDK
jgi:hypothetical protein